NNIPTIESIDPLMQIGSYIGFNFDIGHYVAGTKGKSPIPVIEKYHGKIISLHLKDRNADGANLPWGEEQKPIKEVLQLLKKEKWPIYADIELEYKVPEGSSSVAEVAKCVQFCKEALAGGEGLGVIGGTEIRGKGLAMNSARQRCCSGLENIRLCSKQ